MLHLRTTGSPTTIEAWSGDTQGGVEQNHNAFSGIAALPNGNVLVCYQKAYTHGGINGGIWYSILAPDGSTVVAPTVLRHAGGSQETPTMSAGLPTGAYWSFGDVSATLLSNGEVMVTWFERHVPAEDTIKVWGAWYNTATGTWSSAQEVTGWQSSGSKYGLIYSPVEIGGVLYAPEWECNGYSLYPAGVQVRCVQSTDWGRTFTAKSTIGTGTSLDETEFARFSDGQIVAFTRNDASGGTITRRVSNDTCATWGSATTALGATGGFYGFTNRPTLVVEADDTLWLSCRALYGSSSGNSYHVVFKSTDRGVTFTGPIDPYTGSTRTAGLPDEVTRGWCVAGDFALLADGNIAHVWGEAQTYSAGPPYVPERSQLLYRVLTTSLTADGYGNTVSAGYGSGTAEAAQGSLLVLPSSSAWEQVGSSIFVRTVNEPCSVLATVTGTAGGLLRFAGTDAARFDASLDGVTWASMVDVPPGTSTVHLRVKPVTAGSTLSAQVGVPV